MSSELSSTETYHRNYPTLYNVLEFIRDCKMLPKLSDICPRNYPALCDIISTIRHELGLYVLGIIQL